MESSLQFRALPPTLSLVPKFVEFAAHSFAFDHRVEALMRYEDPNGELPVIEIPERLRGAPAKRKAAFIAGRVCAARALAQLQGEPKVPKVWEAGQPIWPRGIVGGITYTDDYAAAVAGSQKEYRGLGIDAEMLLDPRAAQALAPVVLTLDERRVMHPGVNFARFITIAFSAKESFYNAIFPLVGRVIDFQAAQILQVDTASLTLVLSHEVADDIRLSKPVTVRYVQDGHRILTFTQLSV